MLIVVEQIKPLLIIVCNHFRIINAMNETLFNKKRNLLSLLLFEFLYYQINQVYILIPLQATFIIQWAPFHGIMDNVINRLM
jgi:hypothetical protein